MDRLPCNPLFTAAPGPPEPPHRMHQERFFSDPRMPHVKFRCSHHSSGTFKPHMHRCFSVGVVLEGEIRYSVADQSHSLRPGGMALINPETLHACNREKVAPRSYSMLYLQTDWCLRLQQSIWQVDRFVPVRDSLLHNQALYERYLEMMELLMNPNPLLAREQHLFELMAAVFACACDPGKPARSAPPRVEQLKQLLSADLSADLSLDQLAARLEVNACTLIRQFKENTGITPHAYRTNCRIDLARQLLRQGRDIGDTAILCGFFDQSHLHRHFKAVTTVTPRQYQINFMQ